MYVHMKHTRICMCIWNIHAYVCAYVTYRHHAYTRTHTHTQTHSNSHFLSIIARSSSMSQNGSRSSNSCWSNLSKRGAVRFTCKPFFFFTRACSWVSLLTDDIVRILVPDSVRFIVSGTSRFLFPGTSRFMISGMDWCALSVRVFSCVEDIFARACVRVCVNVSLGRNWFCYFDLDSTRYVL